MVNLSGDPSGRRIARLRALALSEAGKICRSLEVLLKRADFDAGTCEGLSQSIARQEQIELQRAHGRVEPRRRFRNNSSQPLLDQRLVSRLFVDEAGKSNPEPNLDGPTYFALGAIAMADEDIAFYRSEADSIKQEFFGRTDITFHEPNMRNHDGIYHFSGDSNRQTQFELALERLVRQTNFVTFGVGVRKSAFEAEFKYSGIDPYLPSDAYAVGILMLLERYVDYLAMNASG